MSNPIRHCLDSLYKKDRENKLAVDHLRLGKNEIWSSVGFYQHETVCINNVYGISYQRSSSLHLVSWRKDKTTEVSKPLK